MTERWTLDLTAWPGQAAIRDADGNNICYIILSDEVGENHPEGRLFKRIARPHAARRAKLMSKAPELQDIVKRFLDQRSDDIGLDHDAQKLLESL